MLKKNIPYLIVAVLGMATSIFARAAGYSNATINFTGSLVEAVPCDINNSEPIEVDFGDAVIIKNIDGDNYKKTIDYNIVCASYTGVSLSFNGSRTTFDPAAVQSSIPKLGIRIESDGQPLLLNQAIAVNAANPPVITAAPIHETGQAPDPGSFNAHATMLATYQ